MQFESIGARDAPDFTVSERVSIYIYITGDNLNSSHVFIGLPCQDINAIRRKTAERMREYRRRRRNVESERVQEPQHQVPYVEGSEDATLSNYSDFYRH
ncbi:uncharacterized protein TNCV_3629551 [Trichonephila clavipes]|nr:uncharacterized protein TNCV_3629551 [Trichonephila clavipes]